MKQPVEICILAGGLSSRMGQDKSRLRLGGKTLLAHIRATAKELNIPVRVIRRDIVPRCGPLGGIYTGLKTTTGEAILFLACDMPNISPTLLEKLLRRSNNGCEPVFTWNDETAGFPFILNRESLLLIEELLAERKFSLQTLARKVGANKFYPSRALQSDLLNINTPEDWARLKAIFARHPECGHPRPQRLAKLGKA